MTPWREVKREVSGKLRIMRRKSRGRGRGRRLREEEETKEKEEHNSNSNIEANNRPGSIILVAMKGITDEIQK